MADTKEELRLQCLEIAKFLRQENHGTNEDGEDYTAIDYLAEAYDIDYIISVADGKKYYRGARLLLAGGGPSIWLDTQRRQVVGVDYNDRIEIPYLEDNLGIEELLEEQAEIIFNLQD